MNYLKNDSHLHYIMSVSCDFDNSDLSEWEQRVLSLSNSLPSENTPSWPDMNTVSMFDHVEENVETVVESRVPSFDPLHIQPNHYLTHVSIEYIRRCIETFCSEFKVSFDFTDMGTYKCVYINESTNEVVFWINLFTVDSGVVIEQQHMYGGFGFVDIARAFRYWIQINDIIPNEEHESIEELKLSFGCSSSSDTSFYIESSVVEQTVQSMIESSRCPFVDVASEAIAFLAGYASQTHILQAIVRNERTIGMIYNHIGSSDRMVCYRILVIVNRILSSYPENKDLFESLLPDLILIMSTHSLPQIWEQCVEIFLLIGKPVDSVNNSLILGLLHSNPFPTLAPLALKFEAL